MPPHYPPLAGNQSIQMVSSVNAIRMVLNGGYPPGTAAIRCRTACRRSRIGCRDDEVAAVVTYIRDIVGQSRRGRFRRGRPTNFARQR